MGKGRPRAVETGVLGGQSSSVSSNGPLNIPHGPVYYPNEEEFEDPLEYIHKIRPEAEAYGICRIVPPESWKPPFALDLESFTFPTKTQAIHQLQVRPAACDSKTFELEYGRFLEEHCGKKSWKKVVFEGQDLDLCKLFNAVKRYGGYDKVVKEKQWGEVFRFVSSARKIPECAKHVLCQLYREHLYDYESYYNRLNEERARKCKRRMNYEKKRNDGCDLQGSKRRRRNTEGEIAKKRKEDKKDDHDQICEQCKSGTHGEVMLLCDRCNKGWHIYCLSPPLKGVPVGNWYCLECLSSDKDSFGFVPGKCFSLEAFRRMADRAKKKWFGSSSASRVQIEKKFWEIVGGKVGEVEVMYGSDLDTSVYGSGFPRLSDERPQSVEAEVWDRYRACPWNLNNLPKLRGSMLRAVHQSIAGVMVPWMYIGMLFSSFCWHFEDHCFYSMNYLHWGEPKYWYSVPGTEAYAFEKVMRSSLPDLFDAQPDLLFQLVTMLNPSVLQENNVPVYSILQEPGNFVITFPRSYHGGFNLGLNCAEAVNFAPADWLPHGGIGAGLYQLYHKPAVLSHEELLCVVAKSDCDSKVSPYLKKELVRIYSKEKIWREKLWRTGFVNSSPMSQRKNSSFVGTEEDPTCIICHQFLYLSAVVCRCRPSAFACLEHWEHICECKPSKHRLLYRHTLAELSDVVLLADKFDFEETPQNRKLRRQLPCSNDSAALTKKVKGGNASLVKLAEEWILRSFNIFQMPFSSDAFVKILKETEQFLWAGSEMDLVREIAKNLIEAKNWAEGVRDCVSKVENWSCHRCAHSEKVQFDYLDKLLSLNPVPCNEPGHLKLKDYLVEARLLIQEIDSALSSCSEIQKLEILHARACELPILLEESEKLGQRVSSAKVCRDNMRSCVLERRPAAIELDILHKLKTEILELQVDIPETEMLLDLLSQAETCQAQCCEVLEGPMSLKKVEGFLQELDGFVVNVQGLKLLRQCYGDTVSWISRFNGVIANVQERKDQENVINELNCLMKDGASLRIQVDELPHVEVELKKASCREEALRILNARDSKKPFDYIQSLMMEARTLGIDKEKLFIDISEALAAAVHWEEEAAQILASESRMSDFEEIIRASESIFVILPSLNDVIVAVSMAKLWLEKSKPLIASRFSTAPASSSLLKIEDLKELESQSKLLRVSLAEQNMVQSVLQSCRDWEQDASSLLVNVEGLFELCDIDNEVANGLVLKIEHLLTDVDCVTKAGLSLGFDFIEIPKLRDFHSSLEWCYKALSLCSDLPPLQEVERLVDAAEHLPVTCMSSTLLSSLIDGLKWLRKALEIVSWSSNSRKCELTDAEEANAESQKLKISFPGMASQLENSIGKHQLWQEQAHIFFSLNPGDRSCTSLLQLKEIGISSAFNCPELNNVISEVERVEKWKLKCEGILGPLVADVNSLQSALLEIKHSLDRSLSIFEKSKEYKKSDLCVLCSSDCDNQECFTCSTCKDCYHLRCLGPIFVGIDDAKEYECPYCQFIRGKSIPRNGGHLKSKGKRCELKTLSELQSDAEDLSVQLEEKEMLEKIVEQTLACRTCLMETVDFALAYQDKDINIISEKLSTALKALGVAGVYDYQAYFNLHLALTRHSWKVRVDRVLQASEKPSIQQIQRFLKEGDTISIPDKDHFREKLTAVRGIGMQWANAARKVATDSGTLELHKVFELITEGENLPVHIEKELKLLRTRSMLYCICRKPYDQTAMIACDQCDEWYHFDCLKLSSAPKVYICPACRPQTKELSILPLENEERSTAANGEPQTPSPRGRETRRKLKKARRCLDQTVSMPENDSSILRCSIGIDLLWRNRKPFRRAAKKRVELENLSPLCDKKQQ